MMAGLRSVAFALAYWSMTLALGLLALPLLAGPRRGLRGPLRAWSAAALWLLRHICGIRVLVTGREHLPTAGAALIAAKHQSEFDTIVWLTLLPDPVYVLKRELFAIPVYGWHARRYGMIGVDRRAAASALRHLVRAARAALDAGRQVVIFPEGTRVQPGQRQRLQPGIAAMAAAVGLPVIPVATDAGRCWGRGLFARRAGVIHVSVLPPLPAGLGRAELLTRLDAVIEAEQVRLDAIHAVDSFVDIAAGQAAAVLNPTRQGR